MPNLRHGGHRYIRGGELPPGNEDIKTELKEFYEEVVALYCPDGGPNPHQEKLLRLATNKLGFCKLIENEAWQKGPMQQNADGQAELIPALGKQYLAYANGFRLDMRELREISVGKGKKKSDLEDYLEKQYGDKAKKK